MGKTFSFAFYFQLNGLVFLFSLPEMTKPFPVQHWPKPKFSSTEAPTEELTEAQPDKAAPWVGGSEGPLKPVPNQMMQQAGLIVTQTQQC